MRACVRACMCSVCACVRALCVCARERERGGDRQTDRDRNRDMQTETPGCSTLTLSWYIFTMQVGTRRIAIYRLCPGLRLALFQPSYVDDPDVVYCVGSTLEELNRVW